MALLAKMRPLQILAILVLLSLAELGSTVLVTRWLGPLHAYMLFALPMAIGLAVQWWRWRREVRRIYTVWQKIMERNKQQQAARLAGDPY